MRLKPTRLPRHPFYVQVGDSYEVCHTTGELLKAMTQGRWVTLFDPRTNTHVSGLIGRIGPNYRPREGQGVDAWKVDLCDQAGLQTARAVPIRTK